jgi:hypothetical protein
LYAQPELLSWDLFQEIMAEGNFGQQPTDDSVRLQAFTFKQNRVNGIWNTAVHISRMLDKLHQAPHMPDEFTSMFMLKQSLRPELSRQLQLTYSHEQFASLDEFCRAARTLGAVADREQNEQERQLRLAQQQEHRQQQQQRRQLYRQYPAAGAANPAARPGLGSGVPAAGPNAGLGGPQRHPQSQQRYHPYNRPEASPHTSKVSYNPKLSVQEVARRKRAGECFTCHAPGIPSTAAPEEHGLECSVRRTGQYRVGLQQQAQQQQQQPPRRSDARPPGGQQRQDWRRKENKPVSK